MNQQQITKSICSSSAADSTSGLRSMRSTATSVYTSSSNCSRKVKLWGKRRNKQRRRTRSAGGLSASSCPSSHSSSTAALPYLFQLIKDKQWEKLRRILKSSSREKVESLCQERDETSLTCLSLALGHQAPLDIVQQIVTIVPSMPATCDDYGANSLHVGCLNGMSLESLEFILREHKKDHLLTSLDCDLRSPLHQAVEHISTKIVTSCDAVSSSAVNTSNGSTSPAEEHQDPPDIDGVSISYCVELLKMLCKAAPEMVHAQDCFGTTPIDMIQLHKVDCMDPLSERYEKLDVVYRVLKSTSVELYRRKKEIWEQDSKSFQLNCQQGGTTTSSGSSTLSSSCSKISTQQSPHYHGGSKYVSHFGGQIDLSNLHECDGQVLTRDIDEVDIIERGTGVNICSNNDDIIKRDMTLNPSSILPGKMLKTEIQKQEEPSSYFDEEFRLCI